MPRNRRGPRGTPWPADPGPWLTNFRNPHLKTWKPLIENKAQRCVVPATRFAEPDRNTGKPVQWCWFARPREIALLLYRLHLCAFF